MVLPQYTLFGGTLYDSVSDQPMSAGNGWKWKWSNGVEKSEMDLFYVYLWQTMWNHAKKSIEGSKLSDLVFLQWEVTVWQELFAKNAENKED